MDWISWASKLQERTLLSPEIGLSLVGCSDATYLVHTGMPKFDVSAKYGTFAVHFLPNQMEWRSPKRVQHG